MAVVAEGHALAVFRTESGRVVAVANRCRHRYMPIDDGLVEGEVVECPYHGWRFDLHTGHHLTSYGPDIGITPYETREIGGQVEVWLPGHRSGAVATGQDE